MAENINSGEQINLETALSLVRSYRAQYPNNIKAHLVGATLLRSILEQPGCVGIRIYQGLDENRVLAPVLVGVDENGEDMTQGVMVDKLGPCPPICAGPSVLMS